MEIYQIIRKEKEIDMAVTGLKNCVDCKEDFKPTSNVQKRCLKCKAAKKATKKDKPSQAKKQPIAATKKRSNGSGISDRCADCKTMKVLVAAGLVSEKQIEEIKWIIR